jgi:hypothetical protein
MFEGRLVCEVIKLRHNGKGVMVVAPDEEFIELGNLCGRKWSVKEIWGHANDALYWVQVVTAKTEVEARNLPFYNQHVQLMIAFRHKRGEIAPKTERKRHPVTDENQKEKKTKKAHSTNATEESAVCPTTASESSV